MFHGAGEMRLLNAIINIDLQHLMISCLNSKRFVVAKFNISPS